MQIEKEPAVSPEDLTWSAFYARIHHDPGLARILVEQMRADNALRRHYPGLFVRAVEVTTQSERRALVFEQIGYSAGKSLSFAWLAMKSVFGVALNGISSSVTGARRAEARSTMALSARLMSVATDHAVATAILAYGESHPWLRADLAGLHAIALHATHIGTDDMRTVKAA